VSHLLLVLGGLLSISMALGQTTDERYPIYNKEGKVGFIDAQGNEVIAPQFKTVADMAHFREGLAPVMVKEGGGYIDINGHFVIGPNPDFVPAQAIPRGVRYTPHLGQERRAEHCCDNR